MPVFVYEYDNGIKLYLFDARISFTHRSGMLAIEPDSWTRMVLLSFRDDGTPFTQAWERKTPTDYARPFISPLNSNMVMIDRNGVDGLLWGGVKVDSFHGDPEAPPAPSRVMVYDPDAKGAPHELRPYYRSYAQIKYEGPVYVL